MDIEAVLAQVPFAARRILRDDDVSYLLENLTLWSDHQTMITDRSNEDYYLPVTKRNDIQIFCRGMEYARKMLANTSALAPAWEHFCRYER